MQLTLDDKVGKIIIFGILPLLPLAIEIAVTGHVRDTSVTITLALYSLTNVGVTNLRTIRGACIFLGGLAVAIHAAALVSPSSTNTFQGWIVLASLAIVFLMIVYEEWAKTDE